MPHGFRPAGSALALQYTPAANDNWLTLSSRESGYKAMLRDALRLFAAHGAGAAELAHSNAEQAFFTGKRRDYLHWMAICRALDRRMVDAAPPLAYFS